MRFARLGWFGLLLSLGATSSRAQTRPAPAARFESVAPAIDLPPWAFSTAPADNPRTRRAPWIAPLASFVVPGSGQALLGQTRSLGYVVAEGFLILRAVRAHRDADNSRTEYRRLASDVARAGFGTDRPNGSWDYYERLEEYAASGAYELTPGGKFAPETDPETFNGRQWLQARQTYWNDPDTPPAETSDEYRRAIAFYQTRAYQGSFLWSWRDHQLEQTAYIQTIKEANRSKQQLVSAVGLVAANHLVSLVDAYINVRVRRYGGAGLADVRLRTEFQPVSAMAPLGAGPGYRASIIASLPLPRP